MAELREIVEAEFENIERALSSLPRAASLSALTSLELAGSAALLHGLYGGAENLLKTILKAAGTELPSGSTWHRDLLNLAGRQDVLSEPTIRGLRLHLAFRHFFAHSYAIQLRPERMERLVESAPGLYRAFKAEIVAAVDRLSSP